MKYSINIEEFQPVSYSQKSGASFLKHYSDCQNKYICLFNLVRRLTNNLKSISIVHEFLKDCTSQVLDVLELKYCDILLINELPSLGNRANHLYSIKQGSSISHNSIDDGTILGFDKSSTNLPERESTSKYQLYQIASKFSQDPIVVLIYPIVDQDHFWGNLQLFRVISNEKIGFDEIEVMAVGQIADLCAIALKQEHQSLEKLQDKSQYSPSCETIEKLKDEFLSSISHELRTPLSNINLSAQVLDLTLKELAYYLQPQMGFALSPNREKIAEHFQKISNYLQILNSECHKEADLVNELLEISYLEAQSEGFLATPIDLNSWVVHAGQNWQEQVAILGKTLEINLSESIPKISVNPAALQRIIKELLRSTTSQKICISTQATDQAVQLAIVHEGISLTETAQEHLFDKFYPIAHGQLLNHGLGLGLALAQRLAQRIGATLEYQNLPNQLVFLLDLPLFHPPC